MGRLRFILLIALASCSPELRRLKRIEKAKDKIETLVKKYPEIATLESDTVTKEVVRIDTLFTEKLDTVFTDKLYYDTVYQVTQGRATTKVVVTHDTIKIDLLVDADTLVIRDTVRIDCIENTTTISTRPNFFVRAVVWLRKTVGITGIAIFVILLVVAIRYAIKTYFRL